MTNLCPEALRENCKWPGQGVEAPFGRRQPLGRGRGWDGSELGPAEPALRCSPGQEEWEGVEAASLKTKVKQHKFPDCTSEWSPVSTRGLAPAPAVAGASGVASQRRSPPGGGVTVAECTVPGGRVAFPSHQRAKAGWGGQPGRAALALTPRVGWWRQPLQPSSLRSGRKALPPGLAWGLSPGQGTTS